MGRENEARPVADGKMRGTCMAASENKVAPSGASSVWRQLAQLRQVREVNVLVAMIIVGMMIIVMMGVRLALIGAVERHEDQTPRVERREQRGNDCESERHLACEVTLGTGHEGGFDNGVF